MALCHKVTSKLFQYAPTIFDTSENGIFGTEFLEYYGCELRYMGVLSIHDPYRVSVQMELRRDG